MGEILAKNSTRIEELSSILLSTLDEQVFFSEISKCLNDVMNVDNVKVFRARENGSCVLVAENNKSIENGVVLEKGAGIAGHVLRTKKSYFSNSITRDPLFSTTDNGDALAELCVPVGCDGFMIGTLHIQSNTEERVFSREDITCVLEILEQIQKPIRNMKIYLSAKFLNESLSRQIEAKEKELEQSKSSVNVSDTYKIQEKDIIGKSQSMKDLIAITDRVACANVSTLIVGESGTGKEMVARRVHCRSPRKEGAFISIDCSALNEVQLEVEMFGEEARDFSSIARPGLLEQANNGTLFINNIESMPLVIQSKLIKFISEKMAFRVRGQVPYRADVRIIASSAKDFSELVQNGLFREDLFYALNTMSLRVPSLRERTEDIELLASFFLNNGKNTDAQKSLSPGALSSLQDYHWPGNVRELQSVMERAFILSDGMIIGKDHLSESVSEAEKVEVVKDDKVIEFSEMTLDELEKKHICHTLEYLGGNKTKTAKTLGITVKTLYNKLHSYGMIEPKEA
ncbi:sigma-54-dependent Fis family transcriptional regulator [Halobacteriovorax sp. HLS]|uniref:sigma-54-dependent Fis family transcriptional regulator n=1 Tax=Halobacteriovorax sp. HLS TaxID=2234000 RepID=UPI000FD7543D|nr:sigma-54-dependent Fis family transcriptional regulator [Halobacteriovorax sp. HLS]